MWRATSGPQHEVMQNLDLNRRVADHRAALEAQAQNHRIVEDDVTPAPGQPRLRYQRRRRIPQVRTEPRD